MLPIAVSPLPGTPHQQALLRTITTHYASDLRVRAVVVFGSLARGDWDVFSDLDLIVVLTDDSHIHLPDEIQQLTTLFTACHDTVACVDPDGDAAIDLMLLSLIGVSLQYHPLRKIPPEIMGNLHILAGALTIEMIRDAGNANQESAAGGQGNGVDQFLRLAVEGDIALQRGQFWRAFQCLQLMRNLALSAYTSTHGGSRPFYFFQEHASPELQNLLGATIPQQSLTSAQNALGGMLDLVEYHLAPLTNGVIALSQVQQQLLGCIRTRQANLRSAEQTR